MYFLELEYQNEAKGPNLLTIEEIGEIHNKVDPLKTWTGEVKD